MVEYRTQPRRRILRVAARAIRSEACLGVGWALRGVIVRTMARDTVCRRSRKLAIHMTLRALRRLVRAR